MKKTLHLLIIMSLMFGFVEKIQAKVTNGASVTKKSNRTHLTLGKAVVSTLPALNVPSITSVVQNPNSQSILITFMDNNLDETDYELFIAVASDPTLFYFNVGSIGASTGTGSRTYTFPGIATSDTYYFKIRAVRTVSGSSTDFTLITSTAFVPLNYVALVPTIPIGFQVAPLSETSISVSWNAPVGNPSGINYVLERALSTDLNFTRIANLSETTKNFIDNGLRHNTRYTYRIKTCFPSECSSYTDAATKTFDGTPIAPGAGGLAGLSTSSILVNWSDRSSNEGGFVLQRATSDLNYTTIQGNLPPNTTSFTDTGLNPNTRYFYRVASGNGFARSEFTELGNMTTQSGNPTGIGLAATSPTSVAISWRDNTTEETGFEIQRALSDLNFARLVTLPAGTTFYVDNSVKDNTKYFYRVRAIIGSYLTDFTTGDVTTPKGLPDSPSNLVATSTVFNRVSLAWKDNSTNEDSFDIDRSTDSTTYAKIGSGLAGAVTFTDTTVKENTKYFYRVRAVNKSGNSPYTMSNSVRTGFEPVNAPSGLTAKANSFNEVALAWVDNAKNETGVVIERATDGKTFVKLAEVAANVLVYIDKNVVDNATYTYRVFAKNANVNSMPSAVVAVTTPLKPLNPPSSLVVKALSDNEISLTWQDNEGLETGFEIQRSKDGVNWTKIGEVRTNVVTLLDGNLEPTVKYFYRVRAFNEKQVSVFSNTADATTLITTGFGKEKLTATIKVYPNPVIENVTIEHPTGIESVNVYSAMGVQVFSQKVAATATQTDINVKSLPSGIYYVSAVSQTIKITKKIIKN